MAKVTLHVSDVPDAVVERLRARAEAEGVSLSDHIRVLLVCDAEREDAEREPMADVLARIAIREPLELTDTEILAAIREDRR